MKLAGLLWRGLFLLGVAVLLGIGILLAFAASWSADKTADLASQADVVETAHGFQQALIRGSGSPVLVVHGAPGGYDQGLAIADATGLDDATLILPSRPGYLGTPLGSRLLPMQQAEDLADLLDTLAVPQVALVGFSGGAPAAMLFALDHPERVSCLVLISPVTQRVLPQGDPPVPPLPQQILEKLGGDVGAAAAEWFSENDPLKTLTAAMPLLVGGTENDRENLARSVLADPAQQEIFRSFLASVVPLSPREAGTRNDLLQFRVMEPLPAGNLAVPTLVVHGTEDPFLPIAQAREFAAKVPGGVFLPVDKAGHLVWLGPDGPRAAAAIGDFLEQHAAATPTE